MKLKKPSRDHRGEWDLVLDNDGTMVAALKHARISLNYGEHFVILWPMPSVVTGAVEWQTHALNVLETKVFFAMLGVDTAPLEKLRKEKENDWA